MLELQHNLATDPTTLPHFSFLERLLYKHRLVVQQDRDLRHLLLHDIRASKVDGHASVARTFYILASNFYWKGICADVKHFIQEC